MKIEERLGVWSNEFQRKKQAREKKAMARLQLHPRGHYDEKSFGNSRRMLSAGKSVSGDLKIVRELKDICLERISVDSSRTGIGEFIDVVLRNRGPFVKYAIQPRDCFGIPT